MQLKVACFALLASLSPLLPVYAGDICAYTSRDCIGAIGCCTNIGAGTCCRWGRASGYGWSIKWRGIPSDWFGTAYLDSDGQCTLEGGGIGTAANTDACLSRFNSPNYANWSSAKWLPDTLRQASAEDSQCREIDTVGYTDSEGNLHGYKVPEGKLQEALDLIEKEAFSALEVFEAVEI